MSGEEASASQQGDIRHEWYQTESTIVVTIFARNITYDMFKLNLSDGSMTLSIAFPSGRAYILALRLSHYIIPQQSSYKIMQTKIEIKLAKREGIQWTTLEGNPTEHVVKKPEFSSGDMSGPPKYPSSNPVRRDWGAIEQQIVQEMASEKLEGEEGVNNLFQKIYGEGSDEVKRAMNKSFIESGGTVLSTNWKEISKKRVPIKPPDGLEWKKWEK